MHLVNKTPFQVMAVPSVCARDDNHLLVLVKGTFDIDPTSPRLTLCDEQKPVQLEDQFWGEPGQSSLRLESELAIVKPAADVVVLGSVYPQAEGATATDASVRVGQTQKTVRAFGPRHWVRAATGMQVSAPALMAPVPLVYENAYGGLYTDPDTGQVMQDERNPVGQGYLPDADCAVPDAHPLPALENPEQLIGKPGDQPDPWSMGFVAQSWWPRRQLMGTYDAKWQATRNPLLPADYDDRANNAASAGLVCAGHLQGGEPVELINLSPSGRLQFTVPRQGVRVETSMRNEPGQHVAALDTMIIEPDERQVTLSWRVAIPIHWNLAMIDWVRVSLFLGGGRA